MITLSDTQQDALLELCNVGVCKAAVQLSKVVNNQINISIADAKIQTLKELCENNIFNPEELIHAIYANVHGVLEGCAFLMVPENKSDKFFGLIVKNMFAAIGEEVIYNLQDVLQEFGNIVISSAVRVMADMLRVNVEIDVPRSKVDNFEHLINNQDIKVAPKEKLAAIVVSSILSAENISLQADILLIFKLNAVHKLLKVLDDLSSIITPPPEKK